MVPIISDLAQTYEDSSKRTEGERLKYFGQKDHLRVYGKSDFINQLKNSGFFVCQLGVDFFGSHVLKYHGISVKSCLYVVSKTNQLIAG